MSGRIPAADLAARKDMLKRAEMRWMSVEDATIEVRAHDLALLGRDLEQAEQERDEARSQRDFYQRAMIAAEAERAPAEARVAELEETQIRWESDRNSIALEAADLRARVAELEAALIPFAEIPTPMIVGDQVAIARVGYASIRRARAALAVAPAPPSLLRPPTRKGADVAEKFAIGDRVILRGGHPYKGEFGTITNTPMKVFNGWTVRLDNGYHVGAADHQMHVFPADTEGSGRDE